VVSRGEGKRGFVGGEGVFANGEGDGGKRA
jgi:hypothetical protein